MAGLATFLRILMADLDIYRKFQTQGFNKITSI